jgi:hypothetical protein
MTCPRSTVRRLIVVVAIVGISLGFEEIMRRRSEYRSRSEYHSDWVYMHRAQLISGLFRMQRGWLPVVPGTNEDVRLRYHREMARKYESASRYPWLRVEPDPPKPE